MEKSEGGPVDTRLSTVLPKVFQRRRQNDLEQSVPPTHALSKERNLHIMQESVPTRL